MEDTLVRLRLAGPEDIRAASAGEVTRPDTLDARTGRPVVGGLFCERIFGPYDPHCPDSRPQRSGHIELAAPVVHRWFFTGRHCPPALLLGRPQRELRRLIYRRGAGEDTLDLGGERLRRMLADLDVAALAQQLREQLRDEQQSEQPRLWRIQRLVRRLRVVEALRDGEARPEWLVLRCLPVVPTALRPLLWLPNGNYLTSDLNVLYRRVLHSSSRLRRMREINAPMRLIHLEARRLQRCVDALFDNAGCTAPALGADQKPLQSLTDRLRMQFQAHRTGKRVDFSARAPFVPGPHLALHQCGLPWKLARILYEPFLLRRLVELEYANTATVAQGCLDDADVIAEILPGVVANHPVILHREQPLERTGMLAFEPVLVEGDAIRLHPLVWRHLAEDNERGTVSVHLPLSSEAQVESQVLLQVTHQLFSPVNGQLLPQPSADIVMGCYHLTATRGKDGESGELGEGMVFAGIDEVLTAHAIRGLGVHARIRLRLPLNRIVWSERPTNTSAGAELWQLERRQGEPVPTTVGRVLFNAILPEGMPFYDLPLTGKHLGRVLTDTYERLGKAALVDLLDRIKELGFREATRSGLSLGIADMPMPTNKPKVMAETWKRVDRLQRHYEHGDISQSERFHRTIETWVQARDQIVRQAMADLQGETRRDAAGIVRPYFNPLYLLAHSGARGGSEQIRQLVGIRGIIARSNGRILEIACTGSLAEGLPSYEYFLTTFTTRLECCRRLVDRSAMRAQTRQLVWALRDEIVTEHDCGTGREARCDPIPDLNGEPLRSAAGLLRGRVVCRTLHDTQTDRILVWENEMIAPEQAEALARLGLEAVPVRTPMTCQARRGVCRLCYGADPATGGLVEIGTPVGLLAAQALGGTLRFGMLSGHLRRRLWPELYSTWEQMQAVLAGVRPDRPAKLAEITGLVRVGVQVQGRRLIYLRPTDVGNPCPDEIEHRCWPGTQLLVNDGDGIEAGMPLVGGLIDYHELLRICGPEAVQRHLLRQMQGLFCQRGLEIDDRHLEILFARMVSQVRIRSVGDAPCLPGRRLNGWTAVAMNEAVRQCVVIEDPGDSPYEVGYLVPLGEYQHECAWLLREEKRAPRGRSAEEARWDPVFADLDLLRTVTESFIARAMLSDPVRTLSRAALAGATDYLPGLSENAILGYCIPVGTGAKTL